MLRTIGIFASLLLATCAEPTIIKSPRVTNWGEWNGMETCPERHFVNGFKIKYEESIYLYGDLTALNGVELVCHGSDQVDKYIKSGESPHGSWQKFHYCPDEEYVIGFALRVDPPHNFIVDDVATYAFLAYCGEPKGERHNLSPLDGNTAKTIINGKWTGDQFCPSGQVVCGINTQTVSRQWLKDDTGLNNVDLQCCDFEL